MEHPENLLWLIAVAALLLLISFFGKKAEWLLNFALRGIMGTIAIYFINMGVTFLGFTTVVGINFDNGNPWNSGHCDAVRTKYL